MAIIKLNAVITVHLENLPLGNQFAVAPNRVVYHLHNLAVQITPQGHTALMIQVVQVIVA